MIENKYIKNLSIEEIKKINSNKRQIIVNNKSRFERNTFVKLKKKTNGIIKDHKRPDNKFLFSIDRETVRLDLPEDGSFNAGLVKDLNSDNYIMVYRPDEYRFIGLRLDKDLKIIKNSYFRFNVTNCADPRLIWFKNKLLMIYSSLEENSSRRECIRGRVVIDLNESESFINSESFRISPEGNEREKNWMPFVCDEKLYLIASVCPHLIYQLDFKKNGNIDVIKVAENKWANPWMYKEFLRGNTNAIKLDNGNYLATFHTATWHNGVCFYDNGAYIFEGKYPFNVTKCSNRTYLRAEDAIEKHFRKENIIKCNFPVGMVKDGENVLISYGDNDSCVKIIKVKIKDLEDLMLEVY